MEQRGSRNPLFIRPTRQCSIINEQLLIYFFFIQLIIHHSSLISVPYSSGNILLFVSVIRDRLLANCTSFTDTLNGHVPTVLTTSLIHQVNLSHLGKWAIFIRGWLSRNPFYIRSMIPTKSPSLKSIGNWMNRNPFYIRSIIPTVCGNHIVWDAKQVSQSLQHQVNDSNNNLRRFL